MAIKKEYKLKSTKVEEVKEWSKEIRKGNLTKRIVVEKLDNTGFLVKINVYGDDMSGKYKDVCKKLYSETNPLEPVESENPFDILMNTLIK